MRIFISTLFLMCIANAQRQSPGVMFSKRAPSDFALTADPESGPWKNAPAVVTDTDRFGTSVPNARTEIRSRWTKDNLYFLFISHFETMYLKPEPLLDKETSFGLWDYDVVEVFVSPDLKNIYSYKEFEVSPRGEWVDLDIDRSRKGKDSDWMWNSGFQFKTKIDEPGKVWICEMQIPWKSIDSRLIRSGNELRLNLYRIEGGPEKRTYIAWQQVNSESFHTPERFGLLRLR